MHDSYRTLLPLHGVGVDEDCTGLENDGSASSLYNVLSIEGEIFASSSFFGATRGGGGWSWVAFVETDICVCYIHTYIFANEEREKVIFFCVQKSSMWQIASGFFDPLKSGQHPVR